MIVAYRSLIPNTKTCYCTVISKPAFWFLLVSEPQKPIKTNKNQETGKPGNLETQVPFSRNLTCLHIQKNLRNQQKP